MKSKRYALPLACILFITLGSSVLAQGGGGFGQGFILTTNLRLILSTVVAVATVLVLRSQIKEDLRPLQYGIIGLVTFTAFVHLISGANDYILILNGMGYMALLLALYFVPWGSPARYQAWLYGVFIAYTVVTIVLYFVVHPWGLQAGSPDILGWITKVGEVILIGALLLDLQQQSITIKKTGKGSWRR